MTAERPTVSPLVQQARECADLLRRLKTHPAITRSDTHLLPSELERGSVLLTNCADALERAPAGEREGWVQGAEWMRKQAIQCAHAGALHALNGFDAGTNIANQIAGVAAAPAKAEPAPEVGMTWDQASEKWRCPTCGGESYYVPGEPDPVTGNAVFACATCVAKAEPAPDVQGLARHIWNCAEEWNLTLPMLEQIIVKFLAALSAAPVKGEGAGTVVSRLVAGPIELRAVKGSDDKLTFSMTFNGETRASMREESAKLFTTFVTDALARSPSPPDRSQE